MDTDNALYEKILPRRAMLRNTKYQNYDPSVLNKLLSMYAAGWRKQLYCMQKNDYKLIEMWCVPGNKNVIQFFREVSKTFASFIIIRWQQKINIKATVTEVFKCR